MENDILDTHIQKDETQYDYASFGSRFGAYALDVLFTSIPITFISIFGYSTKNLTIVFIITILYGLIRPLTEGIFGASPGKMVLGLKVVDYNFEKIDLVQSFKRNILYIIGTFISLYTSMEIFASEKFLDAEGFAEVAASFGQVENQMPTYLGYAYYLIVLISCLAMLGDNLRKQTLHDKIGGTYVVKERFF